MAHDRRAVHARTADGRSVDADDTVCTLPVSVLRRQRSATRW
jgi:hypothetical protein